MESKARRAKSRGKNAFNCKVKKGGFFAGVLLISIYKVKFRCAKSIIQKFVNLNLNDEETHIYGPTHLQLGQDAFYPMPFALCYYINQASSPRSTGTTLDTPCSIMVMP